MQTALSKVFFSDSQSEGLQGPALERLLDNFEKCACSEGELLMQEGEVSSCFHSSHDDTGHLQ